LLQCVISTQMDYGVVSWTSHTEDSGNAIPPVRHYDHNKINAAAVTKHILYPHPFLVTIVCKKNDYYFIEIYSGFIIFEFIIINIIIVSE
jgi:hypothetical protein